MSSTREGEDEQEGEEEEQTEEESPRIDQGTAGLAKSVGADDNVEEELLCNDMKPFLLEVAPSDATVSVRNLSPESVQEESKYNPEYGYCDDEHKSSSDRFEHQDGGQNLQSIKENEFLEQDQLSNDIELKESFVGQDPDGHGEEFCEEFKRSSCHNSLFFKRKAYLIFL